jgi:hypothetical protein
LHQEAQCLQGIRSHKEQRRAEVKENKTYTDGMAECFELAVKVFEEMSDAYDILHQVSRHQIDMTGTSSKDYSEHLAIISVLQERFESAYWITLDHLKRSQR